MTFNRLPHGQKKRTNPSSLRDDSAACRAAALMRTRILEPHLWQSTLTVSAPGAGSKITSFPHRHLTFDMPSHTSTFQVMAFLKPCLHEYFNNHPAAEKQARAGLSIPRNIAYRFAKSAAIWNNKQNRPDKPETVGPPRPLFASIHKSISTKERGKS